MPSARRKHRDLEHDGEHENSSSELLDIDQETEYIPDMSPEVVDRKLAIEESKLDLEREKFLHTTKMDLMRERFRQKQLSIEDEIIEARQHEHWMKSYWRPAMGWLYMSICAFDFIIAPVLTMLMPVYLRMLGDTNFTYQPWKSITLENGGMIHLAFGAILGVAAWTRGQEKMQKLG